MINTQSRDHFRARSLYKNGIATLEDIPQTARTRFRILNYYSAILDFTLSIMAFDGRKVVGPDHHKEAIEYLLTKNFTIPEVRLLQNLRQIRNDIQYYGTKSEKEIDEFFGFHTKTIASVLQKLIQIAKKGDNR